MYKNKTRKVKINRFFVVNEAYYGEILTTCEKLRHLIEHGKKALQPENRSVPSMLFVKKARVEYHPFGVIGIIIPWVSIIKKDILTRYLQKNSQIELSIP